MKISVVDYDGFNIFVDDKWTGISYNDRNTAVKTAALLRTFNEDQLEAWVNLNKPKREMCEE